MDEANTRVRMIQLRVMSVLSLLVTFGFFGVIYALMSWEMPTSSHEVLLVMLGTLGTAWTGCMSYFFGSSAGSANKDLKSQPAAQVEPVKAIN